MKGNIKNMNKYVSGLMMKNSYPVTLGCIGWNCRQLLSDD